MSNEIVLGFAIPSGEEVRIEPTHMVVTGVTNKSGKTTLLEGLASRAKGLRFLVFKSKSGEQVFGEDIVARKLKPFLQERSDWRYMKQLLESSEKQKLKFETWHILQAARDTKSIDGFYRNCLDLARDARREMDKQIFEVLGEYTKTLADELEHIEFTRTFPGLHQGINVMDLTGIEDDDIQSIIIRSTLEYALKKEKNLIIVIPELWKFSPQGRNNPVKEALQSLVRQGATKSVFIWADSQDMSGTDKIPLKQCYTWILGLQTEINEAEHTLEQINLRKKPEAHEVKSLGLGEFFLSTPKGSQKFYAWPRWMPREHAIEIAKGGEIRTKSMYDNAEAIIAKSLAAEQHLKFAQAAYGDQPDELGQIPMQTKKAREEVARQEFLNPPIALTNAEAPSTKIVNQALPSIEIHQYKPTVVLPVEMLGEPFSMDGKLAVILSQVEKPSQFSQAQIKAALEEHKWSDDGFVVSWDKFVRWEIIRKNPGNHGFRCDTNRIKIVEEKGAYKVE